MPAKTTTITARTRKPSHERVDDLHARLMEKVVGQSAAIDSIVPYVQIYQAGLAPEGRPVGVFLLLGPTGTGKTRTVEALAEVLHGSAKNMLKVDCGEFQMEHEVAKLIGAPPGYLGHRETQPMLTQMKLNAAASEQSSLSIVLFDEIEKAAPSMTRLLLGVLDKAVLRLGDNTCVNFERSMIFLTSNLGARGMVRELAPSFGFESGVPRETSERGRKLNAIALDAMRKQFSPEFVNRIDNVVTYQPLGDAELAAILDQSLDELQRHIMARLGPCGFELTVEDECRRQLLRQGTSIAYGARELKRTIHRRLTQPLAVMISRGEIEPGARVSVHYDEPLDDFRFRTGKVSASAAA